MDGWSKFDLAMRHLTCVYLWGQPGLGKTHAAVDAAGNKGHLNLSLSEDVVLQELLGHYIPHGQEFVWHDGPLTTAMRNGQLLVVNELQRASSAVKDAMLGVLDGTGVRSIALPTGEQLKPASGFRVVATSNTEVGELDAALADRFECVIEVTTPHPKLVALLNEGLEGLGDMVKRSFADPKRAISPRSALTLIALLEAGVSLPEAAEVAFGERKADISAVLTLTSASSPRKRRAREVVEA